jgi:hypothetical protein
MPNVRIHAESGLDLKNPMPAVRLNPKRLKCTFPVYQLIRN